MSSIPTQAKSSGIRMPSKISRPSTAGGNLVGGAHLSASKESISSTSGATNMASTTRGVTHNAKQAIPANSSTTTPFHDNIIIGDKVVVGNRPGKVAFIGEVKFAKGDWVGVVLEEAAGKNDGSVSGVRYFQCEPNHGLFVMLHKVQKVGPASPVPAPVSSKVTTHSAYRSKSPESQTQQFQQSAPSSTPDSCQQHSINIGDRVMVGNRVGNVRYAGTTSFAPGEWAGVELDGPLGKNDGSVQGRRYFECRPLFGLFAPLHKVQKVDFDHPAPCPTPGSVIAPPPNSSLAKTRMNSSIRRVDSVESVNSVASSVMSSASKSARVAKPVSQSLSNSQQLRKPERRMSGQLETLHKALREKEEHVDQLLREIDLSRNEIARISTRADDLESTLIRTNTDHEQFVFDTNERIVQLNSYISKLESEKQSATTAYDDEKRKVEDLQFQLEEQSLTTDEMMNTPQSGRSEEEFDEQARKISTLEQDLTRSVEKLGAYEADIGNMQSELALSSERIRKFEEEIAGLRSTLDTESNQKASLKKEVVDLNLKAMEAETVKKQKAELASHVVTLEQSVKSLEGKLTKKNEELEASKVRILELESSVNFSISEKESLSSKITDLEAAIRRTSQSESTALNEMQETLDQQSEELRAAKAKCAEIEEHARQQESHLKSENEHLNTELSELGSQLSSAKHLQEATSQQATETENSLNEKIRQLTDSLQESQAAEEKLRKQESERANTVPELECSLAQKTSECEEMKTAKENSAQQISELEVKIASLELTIRSKDSDLQKVTAELAERYKTADDEIVNKTALIAELSMKLSKSEAELNLKSQIESQYSGLNEKLAELQSSYDESVRKCDAALKREEELAAANSQLSSDISSLQSEVERLRSEQLSEIAKKDKELDEVKIANESLTSHSSNLENVIADKSLEFEKLQSLVQELRSTMDANRQESGAKLSSEKEKFEDEMHELKQINSNLQNQVLSLEHQLSELKSSFEPAFNHKLAVAAASFMMPRMYPAKKTCDKPPIPTRKAHLNKQLDDSTNNRPPIPPRPPRNNSLMAMLRQMKKPRNGKTDDFAKDGDASDPINENLDKFQSQLDSANKMIEFLHSVIADQQKRLESNVAGTPLSDSSPNEKIPDRPPRQYCDICECFDAHATEDCPQQGDGENSHRPGSPRSGESYISNTSSVIGNQSGKRKAPPPPRPYCTTCEVFGHTAEACVSDLTF